VVTIMDVAEAGPLWRTSLAFSEQLTPRRASSATSADCAPVGFTVIPPEAKSQHVVLHVLPSEVALAGRCARHSKRHSFDAAALAAFKVKRSELPAGFLAKPLPMPAIELSPQGQAPVPLPCPAHQPAHLSHWFISHGRSRSDGAVLQ
jgi:hypothetical protein